MKTLLITLILALVSPLAFAQGDAGGSSDVYPLESDDQKERFQLLLNELRCPKCQNQNIADSDAPIAEDMRNEVYRMVQEGADEDTVVDAMIERFGEFVHYKPAFDARTALLWLLPLIVVVVGVTIVVFIVRRSGRGDDGAPELSEEQRRKADDMLRRQSS